MKDTCIQVYYQKAKGKRQKNKHKDSERINYVDPKKEVWINGNDTNSSTNNSEKSKTNSIGRPLKF
jgi:hypothetical protein